MKKTLGIKYHLRITTLIPVLVVALLFGIFYNGKFSSDLNELSARLGESYIKQLLPAAQLALMRHDSRTLQGLINASTVNSEIKALAFYNADGQLIAYRGGKHAIDKPFQPLNYTGDYVESKKINANLINFIAPITLPKYNLYSYGTITPPQYLSNANADDILGWLSIDLDTQSLLIKRYQMYIVTIFITLFGILISLSIHFFFSKQIYLPINRLRRSMKQILSNEFETNIATTSNGEIGVIEKGCAYLQAQYLTGVLDLNQQIDIATQDLQQSLELLEEKNIQLSLEKKKADEKTKQKSELMANMSHEIRTPISSIIGFSNVLMESKLDSLQIDYVRTVKSSAQDLLVILNDILDYSKMDSGKLHLDAIPLDLRACLDEVFTLAAPNAHKKGIDLIPSTSLAVPKMLLGDPIRVKQILTNLVNNAVKFTDHGYVLVKIQVEQENQHDYDVLISVTDTGIGIAREDQSKLFNAFHQADASISRRFGGTGLGLVICKKLAEAMQGRITLTSEPFRGTTFTVAIKLAKFNAFEKENYQNARFSHLKALCFDENPLYLEALSNSLGALGISCVAINSIEELQKAIHLTELVPYNLACISFNEDLDPQLLQLLNSKNLPTILISKWLPHDSNLLHTNTFLFKPITNQKLLEALELINTVHTVSTTSQKSTTPELTELRASLQKHQLSVLIAEDNPVNRMLLKTLLGPYTTLHLVEDGQEAVNACRNKRYDIILLDLQMPNLNGFQAAKQIRSDCLNNHTTPIIAITANNKESLIKQSQQLNINSCLYKPIDEKILFTELITLHEQHRATSSSINWEMCVQKMSGNQALAKDYLIEFVRELKQNRNEFITLLQNQQIEGLKDAAHKLHGACCFCSVPRLEATVIALEAQATTATTIHELETSVKELLLQIDQLLNEFSELEVGLLSAT